MINIFETKAKDGRMVRLTEKQWQHINYRHPEMIDMIREIEKTLTEPTAIVQYSPDISS